MKTIVDICELPRFAFGSRGIMWWGILGFLAIESTMLGISLVAYWYFRSAAGEWPPPPIAPPSLVTGTITTVLLLVSVLPMMAAKAAAKALDVRRVIFWHLACDAVGIAFCAMRVLEFSNLNVRWDTNAYGSVVWMIVGLHSAHLIAEVIETMVMTWFFLSGLTTPRYFVDATDNALYWYFIVAIWMPCYVTVYLVPRLG
jgi:cytochrome c oxidase subunit 3